MHFSTDMGNIMTEYEASFTAKGVPIHRLEAYFPENSQVPVGF